MAELEPMGSLNRLQDPPAALPFSTSCPGPEHRRRNCVPEVDAVLLPTSCTH